MENNFNALIETFFNNKNDITTRGKSLMELSDFIEKEEDYEKYIRTFLDKLSILEDQILENDGEYSTTGEALDRYILAKLSIFFKVFDFKSLLLKFMRTYAEDFINNFYEEDDSNIITIEKIEEIYDYMVKNFEYFEALSPFEYTIIKYSHLFNSLATFNTNFNIGDYYQFFFFNIKDKDISPIYVTIHEFGHYIHTNYSKGKMNIDRKILNLLKKTGFYNIKKTDPYSQKEALADILAIGIMYNSPYENCDPFKEISKEDKKVFNELVKEMLKDFYNKIYLKNK